MIIFKLLNLTTNDLAYLGYDRSYNRKMVIVQATDLQELNTGYSRVLRGLGTILVSLVPVSMMNQLRYGDLKKISLIAPNSLSNVRFNFRGILKAARRLLKRADSSGAANATAASVAPPPQKFYWLASDGWGKQGQVVSGLEDFAVGAITVELESKRIQGELSYFF